MGIHQQFMVSFRIWYGIFVITNFISMIFLNMIKDNPTAYQYGYGGLVVNFILSHTILLYIFRNYEALEPNKPFNQWIWLTDSSRQRVVLGLGFIVWLVPNMMILAHPAGVTYLMAIFSVVTLVYWVIVFGCILRSFGNDDPYNYPSTANL